MAAGDDTKLALMRAAERLFADRGVSRVSVRQIAAAAGQGNVSAVLYHFGSKAELLECILERHSAGMEVEWKQAFETMDRMPNVTLRDVVGLLVRAIVAKIDDPDGGRYYLALCAQLMASPEYPLTSRRAATAPGASAMSQKLGAHVVGVPPVLLSLRLMRVATVLFGSIADYLRMSEAGLPVSRDMFVNDLIDCIVGVLTSPSQALQLTSSVPKHVS